MTDMQLHNSMESRDSLVGLGTGRDVAEPVANLTSTDSSPTLARISETLDALASLLQSELPQFGDGADVGSTRNLVANFEQQIEELRNQLTAIRTEDGPWRQEWRSKFNSSASTQSYAALLAELEETRRQLDEAKAASEACKDDSQQLADTLLEKTNEAVLVLNDKTCVSCNEKALLLLSCDRRHVIGRWPSPFSPQRLAGGEESAYQLVDMHRNALKGQCGLREIAFIHPDGRTVWCEIRMTGFQWRNAQHVFVTATDVSTRKGFEEELRRHSDFLDNIINAVPDPIFVTNDQQKLVLANEAYCREFLANRELLAGALWQGGDVSPDEQAGCPGDGFNRFAQEVEHQQTAVDGQVTIHSIRRSLFNDRVSSTPYMVAVSRDITEERKHQARLGLLASVFCNAAEGVAIMDGAGTIIEANPKLLEMLALHEKVVDGHCLSSFVKFGTGEERVDWQELLNTSSWSGKVRYAHPDGSLRIFRLSLSHIENSNQGIEQAVGRQVIALLTDITQLEHSQQQLHYQSRHDNLTALPNRQYFTEELHRRLQVAARSNSSLSVMLLDLDDFKGINDNFGYELGDTLLILIGKRLRSELGDSAFVARLGGDEFAVILGDQHSGRADFERVSRRLLQSLQVPFSLPGAEAIISGSVGTASFPEDGRTAAALMSNVDIAMCHAKVCGKNQTWHFSQEMQAKITRRHSLHADLRKTIQNRDISLFYQPKIQAATGRPKGCEALARWIKSDGTMISPAEFIPIAEQTGLILPLGDLVLEKAFETCRDWADQRLDLLPIAVNISTQQLKKPDFVDDLIDKVKRYHIDPDWIDLEITESAVVDDVGEIINVLGKLSRAGFRIAIDDFGTGYSSLSYLRHFEIDTLKIDRSFVTDLGKDPNLSAIIHSIISLAKGLNLAIVAEGIETVEQQGFLAEAGCDFLQGFLISRPVPREEAEAWLAGQSDSPRGTFQ